MGLFLSPAIEICCSSFPHVLCTCKCVHVTALLEEISNIDKFFILLLMFFYLKETISITVEPRYGETLYNEVRYNK